MTRLIVPNPRHPALIPMRFGHKWHPLLALKRHVSFCPLCFFHSCCSVVFTGTGSQLFYVEFWDFPGFGFLRFRAKVNRPVVWFTLVVGCFFIFIVSHTRNLFWLLFSIVSESPIPILLVVGSRRASFYMPKIFRQVLARSRQFFFPCHGLFGKSNFLFLRERTMIFVKSSFPPRRLFLPVPARTCLTCLLVMFMLCFVTNANSEGPFAFVACAGTKRLL